MRSQLIIGTAGHIDHGKTTLIHALCGKQLDSTPEEKERGITINLGFADKTLPSGKKVSFIDVPGHEKLIRTMISGATSMDAVLLCVSAVDGVMPQTKEHLSILKLLGIQQGLIALTMSDLVDEEMIELALLDIEELVEGSFLEEASIIVTAAGSNRVGMDELEQQLDNLHVEIKESSQPFRLSVDRCFVQKGFGVVVTGTARGKAVKLGETLTSLPHDQEGRIRSIQHHGTEQEETQSGQRTAINIVGIEKDQIQRGCLLHRPNSIPPTSILDVEYHHLSDAPNLKDGARVRLLHGAMEVLARITIISDQKCLQAGKQFLQLRTEKPLIIMPNDRCIIRQESPLYTLGGGIVLDPWAQRIRTKHKSAACSDLEAIANGEKERLLERRGIRGASLLCSTLWECAGTALGDQWVSPKIVDNTIPSICQTLERWHKENPLHIGCPLKELVHRFPLPLSEKGYAQLVKYAVQQNMLKIPEKGTVALIDFHITLTADQEKQKTLLLEQITQANLEGVPISTFPNSTLVAFLRSQRAIVRIDSNLIAQDSIDLLLSKLVDYFTKNKILSPSAFKEISGLSRKYAIPMLEWLDSQGHTRRTEKGRIQREHS